MPQALANSFGRLTIELSADDLAEIVVRREIKAALNAKRIAEETVQVHLYKQNWTDLFRLTCAVVFGGRR
jgi:hypothetical protein